MLNRKAIDDLWRIAAAGGGLDFDASSFATDDLWRVASAASGKGARVTFRNISSRSTDELWRLAAAGKGCVIIAD